MKRSEKLINLRKEYFDKKSKYATRTGFEVFIEFDYLLNVDFDWIIKEIRNSIIEEHKLTHEERKRVILTFDIEEISSEHSLELFLTPGVVDGIAEFARDVGVVVVGGIILRTIYNLRQKQLTKGTRENIRRVRIRRKTVYPDGRIEYSESEEDSFTID